MSIEENLKLVPFTSKQVGLKYLLLNFLSWCCPVMSMKKSMVSSDRPFITEMRVFLLLDRLHHTAEGLDGLPAWFLRTVAPVYSVVIAHLINLSIKKSTVPVQWKTAVIRPVAKVANPQSPSDYRPISIVPVLSRMVERQIVQTFIYPAFQSTSMKPLLMDQFAFRPTGSTIAALIVILQHVNNLLKTNPYVSLTSLDFTKALDSVRHSFLVEKLATLELPDEAYNWLIDYLQDRKHATRYGD